MTVEDFTTPVPYNGPLPGDFAVVNTGTRTTPLITGLEKLEDLVARRPLDWTDFDHAVICTKAGIKAGPAQGGWITRPEIVEAEPHGAVQRPWHYDDRPHMWSSGLPDLALTDVQRGLAAACALNLAAMKVGYGWLDYDALVLHTLHIPVPGLRLFIKRSDRLICSQLVDLCRETAGNHLFQDRRWNGYVTPADLGMLINWARSNA